jgi:hypothetical protein
MHAGKEKEGLFDQLPTTELVRQVREGESVDYGAYQRTPEKVAGLLLMFLHQLPAPLIPFEFYDSFVAAFSTSFPVVSLVVSCRVVSCLIIAMRARDVQAYRRKRSGRSW